MSIEPVETIIADIMRGEDVCERIWRRNAAVAMAIGQGIATKRHDPKGCKVKNCVHGNPEIVRGQIAHAATLQTEITNRVWED